MLQTLCTNSSVQCQLSDEKQIAKKHGDDTDSKPARIKLNLKRSLKVLVENDKEQFTISDFG